MPLSRRDFVRTSAIAAAALRVPGEAGENPPAPSSGNIRLGLASYTFRNFTRQQLIGFLKELKVSELNAKDVKDHLPSAPEGESAAVSEFAAAGIRLHAAGAIYFKNDENDIRSKFEYCKRAGIGTMVVGDPTPESLPRVEQFAQKFDIRVAIHNHGPEDRIFPSPFEVLRAVKDLDPRMGCCIDVGHTTRTGTDVVEAIQAAGPRLFNVHMKDLADLKQKDSQVAVGDGAMPVRGIFEALLSINYGGFVDLEYEVNADDPMPGVAKSFAYMRGVLTGMQRA